MAEDEENGKLDLADAATMDRNADILRSVSEQLNGDEDVIEEKTIKEEYKTWKKNAPYLYDMILSSALDWPTLTVQWFPDKQE